MGEPEIDWQVQVPGVRALGTVPEAYCATLHDKAVPWTERWHCEHDCHGAFGDAEACAVAHLVTFRNAQREQAALGGPVDWGGEGLLAHRVQPGLGGQGSPNAVAYGDTRIRLPDANYVKVEIQPGFTADVDCPPGTKVSVTRENGRVRVVLDAPEET